MVFWIFVDRERRRTRRGGVVDRSHCQLFVARSTRNGHPINKRAKRTGIRIIIFQLRIIKVQRS